MVIAPVQVLWPMNPLYQTNLASLTLQLNKVIEVFNGAG